MKKLIIALAGSAALALLPAAAAEKTVVLSVPGMTCALCPITVKKAIAKVPGVRSVEASYESKQAVVTFDDATTSVEALTKATADAGYPSSLAR